MQPQQEPRLPASLLPTNIPIAEAAHGARHHSDTAAFLQAATKDVYGATQGGGASLSEAVGRRAAFSDRRDGGAAFRRHG